MQCLGMISEDFIKPPQSWACHASEVPEPKIIHSDM